MVMLFASIATPDIDVELQQSLDLNWKCRVAARCGANEGRRGAGGV